MPAVLPILAFVSICLMHYNLNPGMSWRQVFLRAAIIWGTTLVVVTEILSSLHAITQPILAIAWSIPILAGMIFILRLRKAGKKLHLPRPVFSKNILDWLLLAGLVFILGATALVAWLAPPQTWDSLNYHLPRVAHWAQNQTAWHYVTGIDWQNSMSPGAEFAVLHFYVLAQGDRLVNFVEWLAMLGSLIAVSWVAKQIGANRLGQFLAMIVAASVPTGIVQASSTMTDCVVAFWVICAASEVLGMLKSLPKRENVIYASLAAGLALLTKLTALPFLLPFMVIAAWVLFTRLPMKRTLPLVGVSLVLVFCLNSGHLTRNYLLYGNPISSTKRINAQVNQMMNLRGMLSNVLRNAGLHAGTPKQAINQWVFDQVSVIHDWLKVDINDPRTTSEGQYNPIGGLALHEDVVGNLFHGLLILASVVGILLSVRCLPRQSIIYFLAVNSTFFLFSLLFKWQIFGSRYHQPFFVLFAPMIAVLAIRYLTAYGARLLSILLMIAVCPWLFSISSRPIIPIQGRTMPASILTGSRLDLYFANAGNLVKAYTDMTHMIQQANCSRVGLMLLGNSAEYPLWVLLDAPRPDLDVEWIVGGNFFHDYENPDFHPCAVICERCGSDMSTVGDLPIAYENNDFRLYLQGMP